MLHDEYLLTSNVYLAHGKHGLHVTVVVRAGNFKLRDQWHFFSLHLVLHLLLTSTSTYQIVVVVVRIKNQLKLLFLSFFLFLASEQRKEEKWKLAVYTSLLMQRDNLSFSLPSSQHHWCFSIFKYSSLLHSAAAAASTAEKPKVILNFSFLTAFIGSCLLQNNTQSVALFPSLN